MNKLNFITIPDRGGYKKVSVDTIDLDNGAGTAVNISDGSKTVRLFISSALSRYSWTTAKYLLSRSEFRMPLSEEWKFIDENLDEINKFLKENNYPVISGTYWCDDLSDNDKAYAYSTTTHSVDTCDKSDPNKVRMVLDN